MRIWLKRIILLTLTYEVVRFLFLVLNMTALASIPLSEKFISFIVGLRFDLAAIATLNTPLILLHASRRFLSSPQMRKLFDNLVGFTFIVANLPFIAAGIIDARIFGFTGRRMTLDFFSIGADIQRQGFAIMVQYWLITLTGIVLCASLFYMCWQTDHEKEQPWDQNFKRRSFHIFVFLCMSTLAVRGGLQTKPLVPAHAYSYQPAVFANLILNSAITLLRTPPSEQPRHFKDFTDQAALRNTLAPSTPSGSDHMPLARGKNIVVIVVESLASEYVGALNAGKGYTPFIDSLIPKSVTFKESFANGRRSIDAMPAIFASIPAWRDQPFVTSPFNGNNIQALPQILKKEGYESFFFHGAANGSMHFDTFSAIAGFDHYVGQNEYPGHDDFDGAWGIFDEPFLGFVADSLNQCTTPFVAGVFTLSSHNPFPVPEKYKYRFPRGTLPIHESIGYADFAISQFIAKASGMKWFNNTIFVITGDHTSLSDQPYYDNTFTGRYRVPIVFFDPTGELPQVGRNKIIQHIDITPTLFDLVGAKPQVPQLFGRSIFDPNFRGRFIQEEYGFWYFLDDTALVQLDDSKPKIFLNADVKMAHDVANDPPTNSDQRIQILKAARQYYSNGLIDNSWGK